MQPLGAPFINIETTEGSRVGDDKQVSFRHVEFEVWGTRGACSCLWGSDTAARAASAGAVGCRKAQDRSLEGRWRGEKWEGEEGSTAGLEKEQSGGSEEAQEA